MAFWNDGITLPNHFASAMADPTDAVCTLAHGFRRSCRRGRRSIMVMCMGEDVEKEKACGRRRRHVEEGVSLWHFGMTVLLYPQQWRIRPMPCVLWRMVLDVAVGMEEGVSLSFSI
jgi:hypothetical protein